jgi:predicted nuclease with TOPRIM domain
MSVIAKILIVVNLLLAVVFLGAAATFLGQQESWKKKHDDLQARTSSEIKDLNENLNNTRKDKTEYENKAQQAEAKYNELQNRFDQKETDYQQIAKKHDELLASYNKLSDTYKDLQAQNTQLTQDKDRLLNEKEQALTEKRQAIEAQNSAVTEQKRLQDQINDKDSQIAELNKRVNKLSDELESANMQLQVYIDKVGKLPEIINMPHIEAKVTGVDKDLNIVLLSVGRDDQVKPGYTFTVYRGNQYVGQVKIDKVEKDYASGYSVKELEKEPIEVGDSATTGF